MSYVVPVKSKVEILQNFVAFSEYMNFTCLSSLGVPWHPQIMADQLTLSQPRGADYAYQMILAPPDFQTSSDGPGLFVKV